MILFISNKAILLKNGPLNSVEELLLIKHWDEDIYGKPADEFSDAIYGIADLLTVWRW